MADLQTFIRDLVIAFPQVDEAAKFNSPDLAATHRTWAKTLAGYAEAECRAVLDDWITGKLPPPTAADIKAPAHAILRVIRQRRDAVNRRKETAKIREAGRNPRKKGGDDCDLVLVSEPFKKLKGLRDQMKRGEISVTAYEIEKIEVLAELSK